MRKVQKYLQLNNQTMEYYILTIYNYDDAKNYELKNTLFIKQFIIYVMALRNETGIT